MSRDAQQQRAVAPQDNSVPAYDSHAFAWSSAAINFAALMEVLKMTQEAYNDMAELSARTTGIQAEVVIATANATQQTYNDDRDTALAQMGEQITSSVTTLGNGVASGVASRRSSVHAETDKLTNIRHAQEQSAGVTGTRLRFGVTVPGVAGAPTRIIPEPARVTDARNNLTRGHLHQEYDHRGIDRPATEDGRINGTQILNANRRPITIRELLQSDPAPTAAEANANRLSFQRNLAADRRTQVRAVNTASNELQQTTQMLQMAAQGINTAVGAGCKGRESAVAAAKGRDSSDQARGQAGQEFMRETNKSQQEQFTQFAQKSGEVFRTLSEIVQVDARA